METILNADADRVTNELMTIDDLFKRSLNFRSSIAFRKFFQFIAKFNHYSRYNTMLVYIQNPAVTFFGTSSYWRKKFGRSIDMEGKPLIILAPMSPVLMAYDVVDTIGNLTPQEFLNTGLGRKLFEVKGEFKNWYLDSLKNFAAAHGIKILIKPLNFFNAGAVTTIVTKKLEIYLKKGHSPAEQFCTLCHELAHILLGHTGHQELLNRKAKKKILLPVRQHHPIKVEELEAETVNFLVSTRLGMETSSMEYLAGYISSEKDWLSFSYELVIKITDKLEGILKQYKPSPTTTPSKN